MVHLLLQMSQLGVLIFLVSEQLFTFNSHIQQKYVPEDGFLSVSRIVRLIFCSFRFMFTEVEEQLELVLMDVPLH